MGGKNILTELLPFHVYKFPTKFITLKVSELKMDNKLP